MDVVLPKNSLTMTEAEIIEWYVSEGGTVTGGEPLFLMETEKSQVVVEASASGTLAKILRQVGEVVSAGETIAVVDATAGGPSSVISGQDVLRQVAPAAADLASQLGIDIQGIKGSGSGGRVIEDDILKAARHEAPEQSTQPEPPAAGRSGLLSAPVSVPATFSRARTAGNRSTVWAASVPTFQIASTLALGKSARQDRATASDLLLAAVSRAARQVPLANAYVDGDEVRLYSEVRVGLLVRHGDALVPLVFPDADRIGLADLHSRRRELMTLVGKGALPSDATAWPTFVISNIGRPGVKWFSAVLYPGTAATLAVGSVGATGLNLAEVVLTCDHRIIDGVDAAEFLGSVSEYLSSL